jgi:hypothetical protein
MKKATGNSYMGAVTDSWLGARVTFMDYFYGYLTFKSGDPASRRGCEPRRLDSAIDGGSDSQSALTASATVTGA